MTFRTAREYYEGILTCLHEYDEYFAKGDLSKARFYWNTAMEFCDVLDYSYQAQCKSAYAQFATPGVPDLWFV